MWVASSTSELFFFLYFCLFIIHNTISDVLSSNDKVEALQLSSAFDITCEAWKVIFDFEYLKLIND
jgi:hypothetical protein